MRVHTGPIKQAEIAKRVADVARRLKRDVVRIRYHIGADWSGDDSIFFRVVLTDEATREDRMRAVTRHVEVVLREKLELSESELIPYFNFRSESEQAELQEPSWS